MRIISRRSAGAWAMTGLFVISLLTIVPTATANPAVPYCGGTSAPGGTSETADAYDPSVCEQATGRVFPEAYPHESYLEADAAGHSNTGFASDFLGFFEFEKGIEYLANSYPDYVEVYDLADSYGLCPVGSQTSGGLPVDPGVRAECQVERDSFPVYMLEITNENSPMPLDERQNLLFMLSIHGVEKGGREGGVRVAEDLLKGINFAAEPVLDGNGLPDAIEKPTGGPVQTYRDMLDYTRVFLLLPNSDGWAHGDAPYYFSDYACGGGSGGNFCRSNGNGVDLNRQGPTLGWHNPGRNVVGEPEAIGYYNWMLDQDIEWDYAIDIHGMNTHRNFAAIMLPAASQTPQEMQRSVGLAEILKQRLNNNPHFDEWVELMGNAESSANSTDETCHSADCPATGSQLWGAGDVGSGTFAEYYTVIDAIGYTDSGFNGDFFAQDTGLNAPGYDIELAYNHNQGDDRYGGATAIWNDYHVTMVREIVKSYMDAASLDTTVSLQTNGRSTLVLENPVVVTNLDDVDEDGNPSPNTDPESWAAQNPGDDLWEYSESQPFHARPHKYWEDLKPYVKDGDTPGILDFQSDNRITTETLEGYDTFVIPGTAIRPIEHNEATIATIMDWVDAGGELVLTDSALNFLVAAGLVGENDVDVEYRYMGGIKVADYLDHELLADVRGGVMQMYEPTPLGYGTSGSAPNWWVDVDAWQGIGGEIAGLECGVPVLNAKGCDLAPAVGLGQVSVGAGQIRIMGSVLPDPTEDYYHPYGLDHYATTYSANAIMLNLLGWDKQVSAPSIGLEGGKVIETPNEPPASAASGAADTEQDTPALGALIVLGFLGVAALVARRRF